MSPTQTNTDAPNPGSYRDVLSGTFGQSHTHETLNLLRRLYETHPTSHHISIVEGSDTTFPLSRYLESQGVTVSIDSHSTGPEHLGEQARLTGDTYLVYDYDDKAERLFPTVVAGRSRFSYKSISFVAYKCVWTKDRCTSYFYDLVSDSEGITKELAESVYVYGATLREEIWVYQSGMWTANKQLYKAVQAASWEDVVLEDAFKEGMRRDTKGFFESKDIYEDLETIWKRLVFMNSAIVSYTTLTFFFLRRGILLLGPPGNGKTESIKALLKETDYPALYVKSFTTPYVCYLSRSPPSMQWSDSQDRLIV